MKRVLGAGAALLLVVLVVLGVLTVRALLLPSLQAEATPPAPVPVDAAAAAGRLSRAVRFRTIDGDTACVREFPRFRDFLLETYPHVAELGPELVDGGSLLFTWPGTDPKLSPVLLLFHQDVVPVEAESAGRWTHPPFSGDVDGGFVWGRGAMDDKGSLLAAMEAMEALRTRGFAPARTVYLGLGHDEETGGRGAAAMARLLESRSVHLAAVFDEGMAVTDGMVPGVSVPVALIGLAEKGYLSVEITAETAGGHSAIPPPRGATGILSQAVNRVVEHPFPAVLRSPTKDMFRFLAPEMSWPMRAVFSNLWLFEPLIRKKLEADPPTNAAVRTTAAVTVLEAGVKENVLPSRALAVVNLRLLPGDTVEGVLAGLRHRLADIPVTVEPRKGSRDPSPVSSTTSPAFRILARTIRQTYPAAVVAPGLVLGGTDSRHFTGLADNVYRFVPLWMQADDVNRIHGINERVSVEHHAQAIRFYQQLIQNMTTASSND